MSIETHNIVGFNRNARSGTFITQLRSLNHFQMSFFSILLEDSLNSTNSTAQDCNRVCCMSQLASVAVLPSTRNKLNRKFYELH